MADKTAIGRMFSLEGKIAVVTGASGAIGGAVARGFAAVGASIAAVYRSNAEAAEGLVAELKSNGSEACAYRVDLTDGDAVARSADAVMADFGGIDILFNSAGGNIKAAMTSAEHGFFDLAPEAVADTLNVNVMGGVVLPCLHYGRPMTSNADGGSIINVTSMNAFRPLEGRPAYAASKAAVQNFTQWLAAHLALQYSPQLRVNAIAPGFFPNDRMRATLFDANGDLTERARQIIRLTPMARLGNVEDLIGTALWYAAPASAFVTGTVTPVDGGFNAYAGV